MSAAPTPGFTLDELLVFLREDQSTEGFYTKREWAEHLMVSEYTMSKLLRAAKRAGILRVTRVPRENVAGMAHGEIVYAFEMADGEDDEEDGNSVDSKGAV